MLKKLISIVPVAALTLTVGANVQAATVTVQKGDTLWDLARANNTSVDTIQTVNHLNTDLIHPGDLLTIAKEKHYTVKSGDTLWDIAKKHHVTVSQLLGWNNLNSDLIHPDLNLLIFEGAKTSTAAVSKNATSPATIDHKETAAPTNNETSKASSPKAAAPTTNSEESKASAPEATAPTTNNEQTKESTPEATAPTTNSEVSNESTPAEAAPSTSNTDSKVLIMEATAYTASCEGCSGITSTGINLKENPDAKVISVDPTVIPLGSKVYVEGYGEAIAGDTGGGIKGNKIDVFIASKQEAVKFGVKQLKVTILD
ncbi:LysM peptidoglycan-binding domain-containing protein [Ureibacillus aquaedulcis]|uniref:LysM peptidoglycan-binding domain-containing protein n=1 Tax=Ureibacillus aquaedulcis TaxID=3058421 RepID=A0ABT8GTW9_9BACL|nr:LysM peptidoglycan-binding domain-containing protein [Ureibacillus sp. BA0131]MDN4494855.1 LysM peptidoglycan-binding domain-containing protein [Ureibacillus sp. BA0131]